MGAAGHVIARRPWLMVSLAATAFVLVALAASGAPVPMATEGPATRLPRVRLIGPETPTSEPLDDRRLAEPLDSTPADVAAVLFQITVVVLIAAAVLLVVRRVVRALEETPDEPGVGEPISPTGVKELAEVVDEGLQALASGPVDDVIIACWVRLEDVAAAGGVTRRPSETSSELAVRVLGRFDVPADPVERLLGLYRAARYSGHRLGEDDRAAAISALSAISAAMAVAT